MGVDEHGSDGSFPQRACARHRVVRRTRQVAAGLNRYRRLRAKGTAGGHQQHGAFPVVGLPGWVLARRRAPRLQNTGESIKSAPTSEEVDAVLLPRYRVARSTTHPAVAIAASASSEPCAGSRRRKDAAVPTQVARTLALTPEYAARGSGASRSSTGVGAHARHGGSNGRAGPSGAFGGTSRRFLGSTPHVSRRPAAAGRVTGAGRDPQKRPFRVVVDVEARGLPFASTVGSNSSCGGSIGFG